MNFTDSPFERMMKEVPRPTRPIMEKAPPGSPCHDCSFWRGMACVGTCYKELTAARKGDGTSGHFVQKCRRA